MEKIRNTAELKEFLLSQIHGVMDGTISTDKAKVVCNVCQQIYQQSKLEVTFAVAQQKLGDKKIEPVAF